MKVKIVRKDEKVFFMDEIVPKNHDHTEDRNKRVYENYSNEQVDVIKESIHVHLRSHVHLPAGSSRLLVLVVLAVLAPNPFSPLSPSLSLSLSAGEIKGAAFHQLCVARTGYVFCCVSSDAFMQR